MEMWTAALKWAMEFDSIVNRHNLAVAADAESAKLKPPAAEAVSYTHLTLPTILRV